MSKLLTPERLSKEQLFGHDQKCNVMYGLEPCENHAQWKIIMACCGGSDFMCTECFKDASEPPRARNQDPMSHWFACSLCGKSHTSWKAGVKEVRKLNGRP